MISKPMPFIFSFLAFCLISFQISAQEKIALIVAIGDYPAGSGWMKINSQNDVPIIKSALMKQGFSEKNIAVIADKKATKKGILSAIKMELVDKASSGGVAYFHYSGHGQQVADNNNDEIDGYDEALVPFDSPMKYVAGVYEGKNLLRDEELGEAFNELRAKLGATGNLLAVIDACHSGTGTRGMAPARGTDVIMASDEYKMTKRGAGTNDQNGTESSGETTALAPMIAFFGAAPNQLNFETKDDNGNGVGSLSYAFSKTFAKAEKNATYRGLFEQIKLEMSAFAPRQQPQAEGALDQQILGGKIVGKATHFSIINWNDASTVLIDAGWLQGINEGSKIGLYASETRDYKNAKPLAEGIVERSRPLQSVVFLEQEVTQKAAAEAWVYVLEKSYGNLSVTFKNELPEGSEISAAIQKKTASFPILKNGDEAEIFIRQAGGQIQLLTSDNYLLESTSADLPPGICASRLVKKMVQFGQAKFLRNLEVSSYQLPLEFEFVPVKIDPKTFQVTEELPLETKVDGSGNLHFKAGDVFKIKVTNNGEKSAYFTLMDIQPDNQLNILIPGEKEEPADFRIGAGDSVLVPNLFQIGPPEGTEVFKLVATSQPIDLRPIAQSKGQTRSASANPFERLFAETHFNKDVMTRSGRTLSIGSSKVNVFSRVFIID